MLTPEQARAALAERQLDDRHQRKLIRAIATLPEALRATAYGLIGRDAAGVTPQAGPGGQYSGEYQQRQRALQAESFRRLDALPSEERTLLFSAFFPQMADAVELAWGYLSSTPYRQTPAGTLRAPGRPDMTMTHRANWFNRAIYDIGPYHADALWFARHAGYMGYSARSLTAIFAAVIDSDTRQGDEIFDILMRSARGEDEVGTMGAHISDALLTAARPEGWEMVNRLLLAAQREEGVRQIILNAMPAARPEAFRLLLETIIANDLTRFTAVTNAVNSWLGAQWDVAQAAAAARALRRLAALLASPDARIRALDGDGEDVALALWVMAGEDVFAALPQAIARMNDANSLRRFAAVRFLAQAHIAEAQQPLLDALTDANPYVAELARAGLGRPAMSLAAMPDAFERIEAALARMPQKAADPQPMLWNAPAAALDREQMAALLLDALGDRGAQRLIPHLGAMSGYSRGSAAELLAKAGPDATGSRMALLGLLGDRMGWVRQKVLKATRATTIQPGEAPALEAMLTRKGESLRQSILELLLKQSDDDALASAGRLLAARNEQQRRAGLEALSLLAQAQRAPQDCSARASAYQQAHTQLSEVERTLLDATLGTQRETPTLENALDLAAPADRAPLPTPQQRVHTWTSERAAAALLALDALIDEHRMDTFITQRGYESEERLLGEHGGWFPHTDPTVPIAEDVARLPFADLWRAWAEGRPDSQRDEDGFDFLRMLSVTSYENTSRYLSRLYHRGEQEATQITLRYARLAETICAWLARMYPAAGTAGFLLDQMETTLATVPENELREVDDPAQRMYTRYQRLDHALSLVRMYAGWAGAEWTDAHAARFWQLARWSNGLPRLALQVSPTLAETLRAYRAGVAREADLMLQLIGPRPESNRNAYYRSHFTELTTLSARKPNQMFTEYPALVDLYRRCAERVVEVELARGEMPTAATFAALSLRSLKGSAWFVRLLRSLGDDRLVRTGGYGEVGRTYTLSHLLRVVFPDASDTLEAVKAQLVAAKISQKRLIEVALFAPQWARHIEAALGWEGFAEAVWWIYAHTRERKWSIDETIRKEWAAQISEWTPLSSEDLYDGAVDVAWFQRAYARLGAARWEPLYQAAKFTSTGSGHTRSQLFADAMLGNLEERTLTERITTKRRQGAVCALGLLPLPRGSADCERTLLRRYQTLQSFVRTSRGFGPQRRASEETAARIGMENLARTTGYADAQRLQWAMELQEVADLRNGPITVTRDEVAVSLRIDALGKPYLDVARGARALKEIPARLKKDLEVAELRARVKTLTQQGARMRLALEQAMCREEALHAGELRQLMGHPTMAPMLEQLVFVAGEAMGFLARGGEMLQSWTGDSISLAPDARLRIAHPFDLYRSGEWSEWQRECYRSERLQPFKQVFRELYLLTEAERLEGIISRRYAGQQVQQAQAMALLGQRGWVSSMEDGGAIRTFHERGLTATLGSLYGGAGLDAHTLTLESVVFHAAGDPWSEPLALSDTPPIAFSEVMRDLDLVVSVAHRGGVDPESSASTVEMRAALIREVCDLLGITNVRLQSARAIIQGKLSEYSVHLGSGTVHLLPGGALCIVPVHEQHRGRIFLPFADDDPRTAEIISKALLLARDTEIKDPLILSQVYARA